MDTTKLRSPFYQHTLAGPVHFVGRALHCGASVGLTLLPAPTDFGYIFERLDVAPSQREVPARWHTVTDTRLSTKVSNGYGVSVGTIEHLIAALYACGIDNCQILLDGPEVPIMDGSSQTFVERIQAEGTLRQAEERRALVVKQPVWVHEEDKRAGLLPCPR